jgi:glycosyltransferase involved in cell wall biosynthesis
VRIIDQLFNDFGHIGNNRQFADAIDLTVCAYEGLREKLIDEFGESPDRAERVYIGIDADRYRPLPPGQRREAKIALGFDPDRPLWGYLGRVSSEKRLPDLVDALALVRGRHDAQVLIQGEGPGRGDLDRALAGRGDLAELRAFAPDALPVLQALDVYLLPSEVEGIPLAVMEAMACGAVPVATAVGGVPELVRHGRTGYLARPRDPGSFASSLMAAARTGPRHREAMAREARALVRDTMSQRDMVEAYARILSRSRAAA